MPAEDNEHSPTAQHEPPTAQREELVELLHGHEVADPYRWLEAPAGDVRVRGFVDAQDRYARAHLAELPARAAFTARLRAVWDHPRRSVPWRRGARWFQLRNDGLQDQDVLWTATMMPSEDPGAEDPTPGTDVAGDQVPPEEAWHPLLDPGSWSEDGTASLSGLAISDDGERIAVGRADAGSDWTTWQVLEVADARLLDDVVPWSKFAGAAWLPDGSGFLTSAYDPPVAGQEHGAANRDQRLVLHRVGTAAQEDEVVLVRPDHPDWGFHPEVSHDGRWLVVTVTRGTDPETGIMVAPLTTEPAPGEGVIGRLRTLLEPGVARHHPVGVLGQELILVTDLDAPLGRVIAVDLEHGHVRELVATSPQRLLDARLVGAATSEAPGWLVCHRLLHATSEVTVHRPDDGGLIAALPLPWPVTVQYLAGGRQDRTLRLPVASFTAPDRLLECRLDIEDAAALTVAELWSPDGADAATGDAPGGAAPLLGGGPAGLVVEQVAVHHDGVAVPLFLVHREDVRPDGQRPTVLWGYGGFDIPVTPMHRPGWRAWVEAGGVLAVACLRGGGEYGRAWHDAGRRGAKTQVFDDALACAAWLAGRRRDEVHATALGPVGDPTAVWSRPAAIGLEGRSNGGLLVGACLTREPDAIGSAVPEVGVLDLVRFHRFTIGWAWTSDYGDPDDPDDLAVLLGYSPYHNLEVGRSYPPTLLTTGDTDDRVVPAHSYKFAAALQHAQAGPAPILLRVDRDAGHGGGKPVSLLLAERADVLAFHAHHLGLEVVGDAGG